VVETRLELALASGRARDVHGGLSTTQDDEVLLGCDGGRVQGCVGGVGLDDFEVAGRNELSGGQSHVVNGVAVFVPWLSCPCWR
jgi:hypothetical protein